MWTVRGQGSQGRTTQSRRASGYSRESVAFWIRRKRWASWYRKGSEEGVAVESKDYHECSSLSPQRGLEAGWKTHLGFLLSDAFPTTGSFSFSEICFLYSNYNNLKYSGKHPDSLHHNLSDIFRDTGDSQEKPTPMLPGVPRWLPSKYLSF